MMRIGGLSLLAAVSASDVSLGSYYGETDGGATRSRIVLKTDSLADFSFVSGWEGYGSSDALTAECTDVSYSISVGTLHLGADDACVQAAVAEWNSLATGAYDNYFNVPLNFVISSDRLDAGAAFGRGLVISFVEEPSTTTEDTTTTTEEETTTEEPSTTTEEPTIVVTTGATPTTTNADAGPPDPAADDRPKSATSLMNSALFVLVCVLMM